MEAECGGLPVARGLLKAATGFLEGALELLARTGVGGGEVLDLRGDFQEVEHGCCACVPVMPICGCYQ
ncbi:MAG: hypothetical protein RMJ43_07110 [Chloroherpetonaceae bacterium]|nr:hypothetical protein [Chthonomonadaceae bacterium]MDW8207590.1 hypothetical protein [Chloroherpetonaceae bacterium]